MYKCQDESLAFSCAGVTAKDARNYRQADADFGGDRDQRGMEATAWPILGYDGAVCSWASGSPTDARCLLRALCKQAEGIDTTGLPAADRRRVLTTRFPDRKELGAYRSK